jgi:hypothetical protein
MQILKGKLRLLTKKVQLTAETGQSSISSDIYLQRW